MSHTVSSLAFLRACEHESVFCHYSITSRLLLDRFARTLTGTCVGLGTLTANRQATTMTQTTVATKIHQTLDAHGNLTTQVTFNDKFTYLFTQTFDLSFDSSLIFTFSAIPAAAQMALERVRPTP
jgi:hypothetical protein